MKQDLDRRIRERAYEIWESEGQPQGRSEQHWAQARAEFADASEESRQPAQQQADAPPKQSGAKAKEAATKTEKPGAKAGAAKSAKPRGGGRPKI